MDAKITHDTLENFVLENVEDSPVDVTDLPLRGKDPDPDVLLVGKDGERDEAFTRGLWTSGNEVDYQDFRDVFLKTFRPILDGEHVVLNLYGDDGGQTAWPYVAVFDKFYRCIVQDFVRQEKVSNWGVHCGLLRINVKFVDDYLRENHERVKNVMKGLENISKGLMQEYKMYHEDVQKIRDVVEEDFKLTFPFTGAEVSYKLDGGYTSQRDMPMYALAQPFAGFDLYMDGQLGFLRFDRAYRKLQFMRFDEDMKKACKCSDEAVSFIKDRKKNIFDVLEKSSEILKDEHYGKMYNWVEWND